MAKERRDKLQLESVNQLNRIYNKPDEDMEAPDPPETKADQPEAGEAPDAPDADVDPSGDKEQSGDNGAMLRMETHLEQLNLNVIRLLQIFDQG